MRSFLISMVLASLVITGNIVFLSARHIIPDPSFKWLTLILLFVATLLIFRRVYTTQSANFMTVYLLTMVLKILFYLAYIVVIILIDRTGAEANVGFFLTIYLVYTTLEIAHLYPRISR